MQYKNITSEFFCNLKIKSYCEKIKSKLMRTKYEYNNNRSYQKNYICDINSPNHMRILQTKKTYTLVLFLRESHMFGNMPS